jgi:hypothetical protein
VNQERSNASLTEYQELEAHVHNLEFDLDEAARKQRELQDLVRLKETETRRALEQRTDLRTIQPTDEKLRSELEKERIGRAEVERRLEHMEVCYIVALNVLSSRILNFYRWKKKMPLPQPFNKSGEKHLSLPA